MLNLGETKEERPYYKPPFGVAARYYWKRGINVFPIIPKTKKPAVKWAHLQTQRLEETALNYYIRYYGNFNIGIVTGAISGLVVVDVDGEEGTNHLKEFAMPETIRVDTTRGYHLYYSMPKGLALRSAINLLPKVDIKADGGYVIAPPSIKANGELYRWDKSPTGVPKDLPAIPEWVLQKVELREKGILPTGQAAIEEFESRKDWLKELLGGVGQGNRNASACKYAGYLLSKGITEEEALKELLTWNLKNTPPMPQAEVIAVFQSILNKDRHKKLGEIEPCDLKTAKERIQEYLKFEDDSIIDIVLATAISYDYECGPTWLVIVGPPSSGKTEILRSLRIYRDTVFIESITSRTLFTGMRNTMGIMERNNKPFMLMINKDFGSILAKSSTEKGLILQQLRGLFDGDYVDETGGGKGTVEWHNRLQFLTAATQDIESRENQKAIGDLGERFLYYKMRQESDESTRAKALNAISRPGGDRAMRNVVMAAMIGVLKKYAEVDDSKVSLPGSIAEWLVELCMVAVKMRTRVKRDPSKHDVIEYRPSPEGVMRMLKSVKGLLIGLAVVRGRSTVDLSDYALGARVVTDSVPTYRKLILKYLYFATNPVTPEKLSLDLRISRWTAYYTLEDFVVVGLADKTMDKVRDGLLEKDVPSYRIKESVAKSVKIAGLEGLL